MNMFWTYILGVASGITANQIYDYIRRKKKQQQKQYIDMHVDIEADTVTFEGKVSNSEISKNTITMFGGTLDNSETKP